MGGAYLNKRFTCRINPDRIKTIFECGSRDGLDALALWEFFNPERMFIFECNPESIPICKQNIQQHPQIKLIEKAVYHAEGTIPFYPTDMEKSKDKNIGASSLLWHRDNKQEFFQKEIRVESTRLDTVMQQEGVETIDLLCMDVQGVEIDVLEGLGEKIAKVQYIITEVVFEHYYAGDYLFSEVRKWLSSKGFDLLIGSGALGNRTTGLTDCLFKNKKRV